MTYIISMIAVIFAAIIKQIHNNGGRADEPGVEHENKAF